MKYQNQKADDEPKGGGPKGGDKGKSTEAPAKDNSDHHFNESRDHLLGGDKFVKEIQKMADNVSKWAAEKGLSKATEPSKDENKLSQPVYHLIDNATGSSNLESPYHLAPAFFKAGFFALERGFEITATNTDRRTQHNKGSHHFPPIESAVDVRTKDKTPAEVASLMEDARLRGFIVKDERERPANQKVWGGPHIHIETRTDSTKSSMSKMPKADKSYSDRSPRMRDSAVDGTRANRSGHERLEIKRY
jgi:hypothetical protein